MNWKSSSQRPDSLAARRWVQRWLLAVLLLPGCAGNAPTPVQDSPYYPLRIGCRWVYKSPEHERVLKVIGHATLEGKAVALLETKVEDKRVALEHVHADRDGIFILALNDKVLTKPLPFLRLPPKVGRTWKVNFKEGAETQVFLIGADKVTVPYGSFDTVTLRLDVFVEGERKLTNLYWFAKDVGIVKHVVQAGQTTTIYELKEFKQGD